MLHDLFIAPFADYAFMRRALVGVIAIAMGGAPVGVFLMLRRMSLTGDAMAHAILPGAAIAYLMFGLSVLPMTVGGLAVGLAVALLAGLVSRFTALLEDASLAAFYLVSLALGVLLVSLKGSSVDLLQVLFGTVLALDDTTLLLLASISTITLVTLALIWRPLVLECVDPSFLRSVSRAGGPTHLAFLALMVLNLVAGFHALGTLLSVGMMMLPGIAARFWTRDIASMMLVAILIAMSAGLAGLLLSYHLSVPSGPAIILFCGMLCLISFIAGPVGGVIAQYSPRRHLEA